MPPPFKQPRNEIGHFFEFLSHGLNLFEQVSLIDNDF